MRKFLLPLLSMVMVFVLSCTSDLKMISEDDLSTPIITSDLADVAFATNFTIRSSGSTSFIVDPGTKSITRYNFSVSFDETNISENGNAYLSAVVSESTYTNGYQIYFSPSEDAVSLTDRVTVKCYLTITYDDVKTVEYSLDVVLNEDAPSFATQPVGDTLEQNFTTEDFAYITFELKPGVFDIDTANISVTGLENRMVTQYSVTHLGDSNPDSVNWYTVALQASRKAVLLSDESTVTAAVQVLYDNDGTMYSISSYSFDILFEADYIFPFFIAGLSDVVLIEDYTTADYVELPVSLDQGSYYNNINNARTFAYDEFGNDMKTTAATEYSGMLPLAAAGSSRAYPYSGTTVTTYVKFTPRANSRDLTNVFPNGYNGKITIHVVYDDTLYSESDCTDGYIARETNLIIPPYNGTTPPVLSGDPGTAILLSDFTLGQQGSYSEATSYGGDQTFTENSYTFSLNLSIWYGQLFASDMFIEYEGVAKDWFDPSLSTISWTTNTQTPTVTFTIQPTQEGIDGYNAMYTSSQDYYDFVTDTGLVYGYLKLGYNKDSDGIPQDTAMLETPLAIQMLPPTPEGMVSSDVIKAVFISDADEITDEGQYLFTWDEAVEICAKKEHNEMIPWDWALPTSAQMQYTLKGRYTFFYDVEAGAPTLGSLGTDYYWSITEVSDETAYAIRGSTEVAYTRSKELPFRVRCVTDKYKTDLVADAPDVDMQ